MSPEAWIQYLDKIADDKDLKAEILKAKFPNLTEIESNTNIAGHLHISEGKVKRDLAEIYRSFGLTGRTRGKARKLQTILLEN